MYPESIQKLIEAFLKFPTIGKRTASRFGFYVLRAPQTDIDELIASIQEVRSQIHLCNFCFNPYEGNDTLCPICTDPTRDRSIICIIEKESDLEALERTKQYKGLYFILGGNIGTLKKEEVSNGIRTKELLERLKDPQKFDHDTIFKEIILGTNLTTEGESTALYVERACKSLGIPITRLARGLPTGGELEYADEETLKSAFEGRK